MGSKQEKRLAKGLRALAKATDTTSAVAAVETAAVNLADVGVSAAQEALAEGKVVVVGLSEEDPETPTEGVPAADPETPTEEEVPAPPAAAGPVLHVKQGLTLRGGRGGWYKLLCKYDGKPVADYIAEGKVNPASHYTARSTKCGQPKTPESRLSWFKRAGIVTIK